MIKKTILIIIFTFLFASPAFADEKFTNSYKVTYQITASGLTNVTEEITIVNKESNYYPKSQTFAFNYLNIGNIKASDQNGEFTPEITKNADTTTVVINFRSKNVGIGKQTKFALRYQTSDIASLSGEIWQILIPGIKNLERFDDFSLTLNIPENFPKIQYVSKEPKTRWLWTKEDLGGNGIFLIFGEEQFYKASLGYFLDNPGLTPVLESITIPPNTNYQNVILNDISPEPTSSEKDMDGNWIFWYEMKPKQELKIKAEIVIDLMFNPKKSGNLSKKEIQTYTLSQKFWDFQDFGNASIKITTLKTIREIYDFTVGTLTYNYNRLNKAPERFTAFSALQNPTNAICTDFTNVFIALARKNGIPAREVNGFAKSQSFELQPVSEEKDILHAWPEYYDFQKESWIMVDPTWENTTRGIDFFNKLDLNHITFVVKGASSETPFSAGSFKNPNVNSKDVEVKYASKNEYETISKNEEKNKQINLFYEVEENQISGINLPGKIILQNKTKIELQEINVKFNVNGKTGEKTISALIPFETYEHNFTISDVKFWEKRDVKIKTIINGKSFSKTVHFIPIYLWQDNIWVVGGVGILIFLTLCLAILYKTTKKSQKNP